MSRGAPATVAARYAMKRTTAREREQLESALADRARRSVLQPLVLVHAHPDPPGEAFADSLTARVYWPRPWGAIVQNVHVPEGPVELLRALIRFDTSNPPGNERPCIEFIGAPSRAGRDRAPVRRARRRAAEPRRSRAGARCRAAAAPLRTRRRRSGGPERVGSRAVRRRSCRRRGLGERRVRHEGRRRDARSDRPSTCASSETPPAGDVILALTTDEEAGSRTGMKFLVEQHAELFDGVRHALSEFGGFTQWHGSRRFVPIAVAEKQRCLIRATRARSGRACRLPSCTGPRARSSVGCCLDLPRAVCPRTSRRSLG